MLESRTILRKQREACGRGKSSSLAAEAARQAMGNLKDQIAVVTGATSGIGKAIALALAAQGAELCLVARRQEVLEDVARQVHARGSRGHACPADLTSDDEIRRLGERIQRDFGRA